MERKLLGIDVVRIDGGTQSRSEINHHIVEEYADLIAEGVEFPAVRVYFDGVHYFLADGFHRYHAHRMAEKGAILVDVENGTVRDAILYSLGANHEHGLRRTNADKRKAVQSMLDDFEWSDWTTAEIARRCRVSERMVERMREESKTGTRKFAKPDGTVGERKAKNVTIAEPTPKEEPVAEGNEHDEMVAELVAENERINDRLAVAAMDGTAEEKALAAETIDTLREEVRILKIELTAVKGSRDRFQSEVAQLKKQCAMYAKKLKGAGL